MSESSENEDLELNEDQSSVEEEGASDDEAEDNADEGTDDEMTVCDDGTEEPDVNASATESDEDDEVDDDEDIPATKTEKVKAPALTQKTFERITNTIKKQHEKRKGRQLYIRFPEKLPESMEEFQKKVKSLSELIVDSHKPRQKHARFCLVDFATTEDRDKALKELKKNDSKIVVSIPKTDNEEFIKTLVEKKVQQSEKKRAKNLLRKQSKKNVMEKKFTPILLVLNLPSSATTAQIKELFPNAVDIQTKGASGKYAGKMIATVTMPSNEDARVNSKKKLVLGGNSLIIRFNYTDTKKRDSKKKKKAPKKTKTGVDPGKGPIAPVKSEDKKKKNAPKKAKTGLAPAKGPIAPVKPEDKKSAQSAKRSISKNGNTHLAKKKAKAEVSTNENNKK